MKKLLISSIAALATIGAPAFAADMAVKMPVKAPPPAPAPVYSWTGCYIGGNVGGGWRRTTWEDVFPTVPFTDGPSTQRSSSVVGGADLGCNYQIGNLVIGIEGNWTAANFGDAFSTVPDVPADGFTRDMHSDAKSLYDVAGRLGYAQNNWLFYAKGGWAGTKIDLTMIRTFDQLPMSSDSIRLNGFVAGGGIDYGWLPNVIVGVEYDFYGFKPGDQNNVPTFNGFLTQNYVGIKHSVQTVTAHFDFLFNGVFAPAH